MSCPCGTTKKYAQCCEPFILEKALPETAEQLMRARYTAYTVAQVDFIKNSLAPESRKDFDFEATKKWAKEAKWKKLTIMSTQKGTQADDQGTVEFCAAYEYDGEDIQLHEVSQFRKSKEGQWFFVDGDAHSHPGDEDVVLAHSRPATFVRTQAKIGRNDPCSCGSGKKYKKCCGA
ncbi:MAG: YchJ family protein [Deltaproteobacteria bacterium]